MPASNAIYPAYHATPMSFLFPIVDDGLTPECKPPLRTASSVGSGHRLIAKDKISIPLGI